jgi:hypothetical protein
LKLEGVVVVRVKVPLKALGVTPEMVICSPGRKELLAVMVPVLLE